MSNAAAGSAASDDLADDLVDQLAGLAIDAALAGAELIAASPHPSSIETKSSSTDPVTDVDRACEARIISVLRSRRPDDTMLGEEGGQQAASSSRPASGVRWVIDPIDGTVNFVLGLPIFAVSVAAEIDGVVVAGCVVDAGARGGGRDVFHARRGGGSFLGLGDTARRLTGPREVSLAQAVVGTGFSYDAEVRSRQGAVLAAVLGRVANLRRLGSAALDLCYLADGRLDAYYEAGTKPWDRAAGMLIAAEAGVTAGALDGRADAASLNRCLLAARTPLFDELGDVLRSAGADSVTG